MRGPVVPSPVFESGKSSLSYKPNRDNLNGSALVVVPYRMCINDVHPRGTAVVRTGTVGPAGSI